MKRFILFSLIFFFLVLTAFASPNNIYYGDYHSLNPKKISNKQELYQLGLMTLHGYGQMKSEAEGINLITESARKGYLPAQLFMGNYYLRTNPDEKKSFYWFYQAARQNNITAQMACSAAYLYGYGTTKSPTKAKQYIIRAAQKGNPLAQYTLAKIFLNSRYRRDQRLGNTWLNKAAEQGFLPAKAMLANKKPSATTEEKLSAQQQVINWVDSVKQKPSLFTINWSNPEKQQTGIYNMPPKLQLITRQEIFQEPTTIENPNNIKISEFVNLLGKLAYKQKTTQVIIPRYQLPATVNHQALFEKSMNQAVNGVASAQFLLGMMYEQGVGTKQDFQQALDWYQKAADQGYIKAEYNIGLMYLEGNGVNRNYNKAIDWLEKAAFKGNANAQYLLAVTHEAGFWSKDYNQNIPKNIHYATGMYNLAAGNNHPQAQFNLAQLYASGTIGKNQSIKSKRAIQNLIVELYQSASKHGIKQANIALAFYYIDSNNQKNQQWAFETAKQAAKQGNTYAAFILGLMYDRGVGTKVDKSDAIEWYEVAAKADNPIAKFILGSYYYLGEEVGKSTEKATTLLNQAATQGFNYAEYNLALIDYNQGNVSNCLLLMKLAASNNFIKAKQFLASYEIAQLTDFNKVKEAAKTFQSLAEQGYPKAQLRLGYLYATGIYLPKSIKQAQHWYKQAAMQNNALAQYLLADSYQQQADTLADIKQATKWYLRAAKQNFIPAKNALGFVYETLYHDNAKAKYWYQAAAEANNPQAEFNLGLLYEFGKGVTVNYEQAYQWFKKAAAQNFAPAQYSLAMLYLQGSSKQQRGFAGLSLANLKFNKEDKQAVYLLSKAANQGDALAAYQLAVLYESGVGTAVNSEKAIDYYQQASDKGLIKAKLALARIYQLGLGTAVNETKAKAYYKQANATGNFFENSKLVTAAQSDQSENSQTTEVTPNEEKEPLNHLYMQAINYLNSGEKQQAMTLFRLIGKEYPDYAPAKKIQAYLEEQYSVNKQTTASSPVKTTMDKPKKTS